MRRSPLRAVRTRRGVRAARHDRLLGGHAARRRRDTASASAPCTTPHRRGRAARPLRRAGLPRAVLPGGGGRGPMRQLARLYEALLARGELDGHRVLSPQTVEAITARHRVGLYDETYHVPCDWGLGLRHRRLHDGSARVAARVRPRRRVVGDLVRRSRARSRRGRADQRHVRQRRPLPPPRRGHERALRGSRSGRRGAPGRDKPFPTVELTAPTADSQE